MKRLITILAVFSLACLSSGVANAHEDMPPGPYHFYVDIGTLATENQTTMGESPLNMLGWGPTAPGAIGGNYGGISPGSCRPVWSPTEFDLPHESWADIDLDFGRAGGTKTLFIRYLDGLSTDNQRYLIDGVEIGVVITGDVGENWYVWSLDVSDYFGDHTLRIEATEPPGTYWDPYGQVAIDQIGITIEYPDPVIAPIAVDPADPINCNSSKTVNFHYTPGGPHIRGYTVRVECDAELTFGPGDVTFFEVPDDVTFQTYVTEVVAGHIYDLDYAILGGSVGISEEADLFSVDFHGAATGQGEVTIVSVFLSALDGTPITPVDHSGVATIDVDCVPPEGSFVINNDEPYTTSMDVTLNISVTGATLMRFSNDGVIWDDWVGHILDKAWAVTAGDGLKTVYGEFIDVAGNVLEYNDEITLDTTAPIGSFVINNDADCTSLVDVTLDNSVTGAAEMRFSNDGSTWIDWVVYDAIHAWTLPTGDGTKMVYGEFRDGAGLVLTDADDIILDTEFPTGGFVVNNDDTYTGLVDVTLNNSVTLATEMRFSNDGSIWSGWVDYAATHAWTLTTGDGTKTVYGEFKDCADNTLADDDDIILDTAFPTGGFVINNDDTYTNTVNVTLDNSVTLATEMRFSNDGSTWDGWIGYAATHAWTIPGGDGTKTVYGEFRDAVGPVLTDNDDIILDTTAPGAVSGITADRGHNKITVNWTNPEDGETAAEVWRHMWYWNDPDDDPDMGNISAYPEYSDVHDYVPGRLGSRQAVFDSPLWELAFEGDTPGIPVVDDPLERSIYYYEVFVKDAAGNWSIPAADYAFNLSYLLGDIQIPYDGIVHGGDMSVLGAAYGETDDGVNPDPAYNNECDVGPTDDFTGFGVPLTDNVINFQDLMILALNWDVGVTKTQPTGGSMIAIFSWVEVDESTWSLVLVEPCANLKGVNLQADLPQDAALSVTAGSLLGQQDNPYFLKNIPRNGLDAGLALLGNGACITGQGELIRISLAGEFDPEDILIVARDTANKDLEYSVEEATAAVDMPTRYALSANYPNPFNPSTKIEFALPEAQLVRLAIFAVDGRRIATLKNESMPAGHHSVTWTGRDDRGGLVAAGVYFYRIQAGEFSQTHKMTLVK